MRQLKKLRGGSSGNGQIDKAKAELKARLVSAESLTLRP